VCRGAELAPYDQIRERVRDAFADPFVIPAT